MQSYHMIQRPHSWAHTQRKIRLKKRYRHPNVQGFPDSSVGKVSPEETPLRFWVGKIPWRRERLPTPVFWPGEFHGLDSLWDHKESEMTEQDFHLNLSFLLSGHSFQFSSVQSLSHVRLFVTPWTAACQASLSITNSQSLLKLMSIESVMPSNHLILYCPLLLLP